MKTLALGSWKSGTCGNLTTLPFSFKQDLFSFLLLQLKCDLTCSVFFLLIVISYFFLIRDLH